MNREYVDEVYAAELLQRQDALQAEARQIITSLDLFTLLSHAGWHHLPNYPYQVGGMDVYDAVLEHGVRTPSQFEAYLSEHGMPTR